MKFELRRGPMFELSDGLRPARGESWVDPAGGAVRAERRRREVRAEWMRGEARAKL